MNRDQTPASVPCPACHGDHLIAAISTVVANYYFCPACSYAWQIDREPIVRRGLERRCRRPAPLQQR